jgi:hypothetical protein
LDGDGVAPVWLRYSLSRAAVRDRNHCARDSQSLGRGEAKAASAPRHGYPPLSEVDAGNEIVGARGGIQHVRLRRTGAATVAQQLHIT